MIESFFAVFNLYKHLASRNIFKTSELERLIRHSNE